VISRGDLETFLDRAGIDQQALALRGSSGIHRMLVREPELDVVESGPHRRIALPDESSSLKLRLANRPALGAFIGRLADRSGLPHMIAVVRTGSYWLNNRHYAAYLRNIADAQITNRYLRGVGLTDKFRGGFRVGVGEFDFWVPRLACQAFCGGPDVAFISPSGDLVVVACHEQDVHVETTEHAFDALGRVFAADMGLCVTGHGPA